MKMVHVNWEERMILNAESFVKMEKTLKAEINANLADNPEYSFETWINANYTAHDIISSSEAWQMSLAHEYAHWFSKQVQELLDEALASDWELICVE
jgi:hypothetical protein